MPCHVDPILAKDNEINKIVKIIDGKITIEEVGDNFNGKYPTVDELVKKFKRKYKTFNYEISGHLIVMISPCPNGC